MRPELTSQVDPDIFLLYYYSKEELVTFCRKTGLSTSGGKQELTNWVTHYLRTKDKLESQKKPSNNYTVGTLTPDTIIEANIRCSEIHRAFFKKHLGPGFKFNTEFQTWLKSNAGKTYQDAFDAYWEIQQKQKTTKTKIGSQFEYNTYIRDFFQDNHGKTLEDAIICWSCKRALPGTNKYERSDLKFLSPS